MPQAAALSQIPEFPRDIKPTPERRQHNRIVRIAEQIADETGAPSSPYRAVDTLGMMERNRTITATERQAGEQFRHDFRRAHLDPLKTQDIARPRVDNAPRPSIDGRTEGARKRVWDAIRMVGGIASPAGSCLWHVVGWEQSLCQWAIETARPKQMASGVLLAALGALVEHYGLRGRASS